MSQVGLNVKEKLAQTTWIPQTSYNTIVGLGFSLIFFPPSVVRDLKMSEFFFTKVISLLQKFCVEKVSVYFNTFLFKIALDRIFNDKGKLEDSLKYFVHISNNKSITYGSSVEKLFRWISVKGFKFMLLCLFYMSLKKNIILSAQNLENFNFLYLCHRARLLVANQVLGQCCWWNNN